MENTKLLCFCIFPHFLSDVEELVVDIDQLFTVAIASEGELCLPNCYVLQVALSSSQLNQDQTQPLKPAVASLYSSTKVVLLLGLVPGIPGQFG